MTSTTPTDVDQASMPLPSSVPRVTLGVVGVALAANAVALGAPLFLDARDYSQVADSGLHLAHYVVWTACLVALSQLYPALGGLRGRDGRALPVAVLRLAGAGAALAACATFVQTFVNPYLAAHDPALLDSAPDAILLVPLLATSAAAMVGTAAFGIAGGLRRVIPMPAAVLLVLGGLVIPVLGPVSNLFVGAGLVWVAAGAGSRVRP